MNLDMQNLISIDEDGTLTDTELKFDDVKIGTLANQEETQRLYFVYMKISAEYSAKLPQSAAFLLINLPILR